MRVRLPEAGRSRGVIENEGAGGVIENELLRANFLASVEKDRAYARERERAVGARPPDADLCRSCGGFGVGVWSDGSVRWLKRQR